MWPVGSFDRMQCDLINREDEKGTDIPITVGILIADFRRQYCKENIINQINRLDKNSGNLIDFYMKGYCKTNEMDDYYLDSYQFKSNKYVFSPNIFDSFVEELEKINIEVIGHTQLILLLFIDKKLCFDDILVFDLEKMEIGAKIKSVRLFFDFIIDISRSNVEFKKFQNMIKGNLRRHAVLEFLKQKLPDALLAMLLS